MDRYKKEKEKRNIRPARIDIMVWMKQSQQKCPKDMALTHFTSKRNACENIILT